MCQNAQNLLITSAISMNTDEKQGSETIQVKQIKFLKRRLEMTLLIIALAMTATMGFYALHLAESESIRTNRLQKRSDRIAGFAAL